VSVFLVSGATSFDGYNPGETFETVLDPDLETRAIRRGSLTLIERSTPVLQPGSYRLPSQHEGGKQ